MKTLLKLAIGCSLLGLWQGCGAKVVEEDPEGEQAQDPGTGPFINIGIYNQRYARLDTVSQDDVTAFINGNNVFFLTSPNDEVRATNQVVANEEYAPDVACSVIHDRVRKVGVNTIELDISLNEDRCNFAAEGQIQKREAVRAYARWTCSETDITVFDGTKAIKYFGRDFCPGDSRQESIIQYEKTITYTDGEGTLVEKKTTTVSASDGSPCVQTQIGDSVHIPDCGRFLTYGYGSPRDFGVRQLIKLEAHNLKGTAGGTFYETGVFDVTLNRWKGQVQFGAFGIISADQPPTYRFTRGTAVIDGTFQYKAPGEPTPPQPNENGENSNLPPLQPPGTEENEPGNEEETGEGEMPNEGEEEIPSILP